MSRYQNFRQIFSAAWKNIFGKMDILISYYKYGLMTSIKLHYLKEITIIMYVNKGRLAKKDMVAPRGRVVKDANL